MIIAIDGPSGAGKSTVSKSVAKALGFNCLDTGAMYRSIAWYALEHGVSLEDSTALGEIARVRFRFLMSRAIRRLSRYSSTALM